MLRNRRVGSYSIPRYPRGSFAPWREPAAMKLVRKGAASAALLALLESCDDLGTGVTGPPPVRPDLLTENEARAIITDIFAGNGIQLTADVPLSVILGPGDTARVVLDGYNDVLRVGYEYRTVYGDSGFTTNVVAKLAADAEGAGPYIQVTGPDDSTIYIERLMQAFIDTLKAHGKI